MKSRLSFSLLSAFIFVVGITFVSPLHAAHAQAAPGGVAPSNLQLWLRANQEILNTTFNPAVEGDVVEQWDDTSANSFTYSRVDPFATLVQPIFREAPMNFNPAVYFESGSPQTGFLYLTGGLPNVSAISATGAPITINTAFDNDGTSTYGFIFGQDVPSFATNGYAISHDGINHIDFETGPAHSTSVIDSLEPTLLQRSFNSASSTKSGYTNGLADPTVINPITPIDFETVIGRDITGYIPEISIYDKVLSAIETERVNTYYAIKYGITLDNTDNNPVVAEGTYSFSNAQIVWSDILNHHNDITVIGRDDASELDQKVSKSINADNFITLATDSDFVSPNEDPGRTSLANFQSVAIGNDDGSINAWSTLGDVPTDFSRIEREWQALSTIGAGTIYIQVDIDDPDADLPTLAGTGLYLLIDDNQNNIFSDETPLAMTDMGGGLWEAPVTSLKSTIFTLATYMGPAPDPDPTPSSGSAPTRKRFPVERAPEACDDFFLRNIRKGDKYIQEVAKVQNFLDHHMGTTIQVDDIFGVQTESTVKFFQSYYNLRVDGIVGPETRGELNKQYCAYRYQQRLDGTTYGLHGSTQPITTSINLSENEVAVPVLQYGIVHDEVITLQKTLNARGFMVATAGLPGSVGYEYNGFGRATEIAVRKFQKAYRLPVTGKIDSITRAALNLDN